MGEVKSSWRLYFDATFVYFGRDHLPYAILALVMLLVFVILPMLLLFLYPFRWFQNLFPFRWYVLHTCTPLWTPSKAATMIEQSQALVTMMVCFLVFGLKVFTVHYRILYFGNNVLQLFHH